MRFPKNNNGVWSKFASSLHKDFWEKSWFFRWVLTPLITGVIPAIILAYYSKASIAEDIRASFPSGAKILDNNSSWMLIGAFVYPTLLIAFARAIVRNTGSNGTNQKTLLTLISTLDAIVGCKAKRFGEMLTSLSRSGSSITAENLFVEITKPNVQIAELVRGVCMLFTSLYTNERSDTLIKVVLIETRNNRIIDLPIYFPEDEPPRTSVQVLNSPTSTAMIALRTKRMVIVPSTKKELSKAKGARFVRGEESGGEYDCSLICYPIRHEPTKSIPFIVSIHSDEPGILNNKNKEQYEHILGRFESRICLEYSLMRIKDKVG